MKNSNSSKTVVFVHGAWMVPASWDKFKNRFEAAGYKTLVPTWPHMDRPLDELRKNPHPDFGRLTVGKIADHYEAIIRALPEPPLLVGHSFGGLIVQLLLDRGVGSAGIAIDPAPIGGVIVDPISLKSALPIFLRFNAWNRPFVMTKDAFDRKFANTAPADQRADDYAKYVVPAPGRIFHQAALSIGTVVNAKARRQPLLLMSADQDVTAAPPIVEAAYRRQKKSAARTDYQAFKGLSHYLIAEPGWEKVADASIRWSNEVLAC